jgi:hypothetical protein
MLALSMRVRVAGGMPQPMEVFAIGDEVGSESAKRLLGLDDTQFSNLFALGASHLNPVFTAAPPLDVAVMTKALCGVPVTQLARDYGVSVQQVVDMLDRIP